MAFRCLLVCVAPRPRLPTPCRRKIKTKLSGEPGSVNCGSRCALRLHVRDEEVYWVETDNTGLDTYGDHQVRACLRGRSIRRRINHPERLNYPMKRVGKRGEGKFERISWDEALEIVSHSLKQTVEKYGNEAVYINYSSGVVGGISPALPLTPRWSPG